MTRDSRTPGIVHSVDRARREVRVRIPGMTDDAELQPLAEIEYPIGDKSEHTEIRILEGDRVWLAFINGDPRYPIITGYRTKHTGNEVGTRRWHHDNIESDADDSQVHTAGADYSVTAGENIVHDAGANITQDAGTDIVQTAGANLNGSAGDQIRLNVGGNSITINNSAITLAAGGSTIVIDGAGVSINGTMIELN